MAGLPTISGREARNAFLKELAKGTLRGLLRSAGMTPERFIDLL